SLPLLLIRSDEAPLRLGYVREPQDRFKTYLTAELAIHVTPNVTAGQGLRLSGAVLGGFQLRTYVFE
ncbi:MAG TPA: hypothetical protein VLQ79_06840, partial [Myxococcaceae bacterium]|nr:hypothetical protein [Myxococcaceae bacterium]